jgi:uncharacterized protein
MSTIGRLLALLTTLLVAPGVADGQPAPAVDHHQHLFSPTITSLSPGVPVLGSDDLLKLLDDAGIRRAVVLSVAYQFGNPNRPPFADEYAQVKAENDWTGLQVAMHPDRLRGFCGVNPLKDYALEELARCAKNPHLRYGLKLHIGNSDVDFGNPAHVARLREVFAAADAAQMAILLHLRSSVTRQRPYGNKQAEVFLNQVLPAAPHVVVQIAHLAGAGSYDDPAVDEALGVFAAAVQRRDPRMAHVLFDVSGLTLGQWEEKKERIAERVRQLGVERVLFGSDGAAGGNLMPREAWAAFRKLPLSETEFATIAANVAPYMK